MIYRFHAHVGRLSPLAGILARLGKDAGEERIVDLQQEPGTDDRLVLSAHRLRYRVKLLFLATILVIPAASTRCHGRHEYR
jgi:hypothetical protein